MLRIPPLACKKVRDLLSSSDNLLVDVMIRAIPRYHPMCALLNQFCSLSSARISISLRLNSSDLLLPLETFNKEVDIFICSPFWSKNFLHPVTRYKRAYIYFHNFSISVFSSSETHQSECLDGCQAIGINSFLTEAF